MGQGQLTAAQSQPQGPWPLPSCNSSNRCQNQMPAFPRVLMDVTQTHSTALYSSVAQPSPSLARGPTTLQLDVSLDGPLPQGEGLLEARLTHKEKRSWWLLYASHLQNPRDWVSPIHRLIFHSSGGWELQDHGADRSSLVRTGFRCVDGPSYCILVWQMLERGSKLLGVVSLPIRVIISSWVPHLQILSLWRLRYQHTNLGDGQKHSVHNTCIH